MFNENGCYLIEYYDWDFDNTCKKFLEIIIVEFDINNNLTLKSFGSDGIYNQYDFDHNFNSITMIKKLSVKDLEKLITTKEVKKEMTNVANKLKTARAKKGLTLQQVATKAKTSTGYLHDMENGRRNPSPEMLKRLSKVLFN